VVTTQDIFMFEQEGLDEQGNVVGSHRATGLRPRFSDRLARVGIKLGHDLFDPGTRVRGR